jgi:hypothetical protein
MNLGTWAVLKCTTHATPGTVKPLSAATTYATQAIVRAADSGNTATITIGPDTNSDYLPLAAGGGEYMIPGTTNRKFDLSAWYAKSTVATQSFQVLYIS